MPAARHALALLLLALALGLPALATAQTPKSAERNRQKQEAEQERVELRKKLTALKADIAKTEKAHGHAADALAASEAAISNANRALRELAAEQQRIERKLELLKRDQKTLGIAVEEQRRRLRRLLREQYVAGHDDRLRLLLSGDNPNRIARELRYLGYISAEQTKAIGRLQDDIAATATNQADTEEARAALADIAEEQREQRELLEQEKAKRQALVAQLEGKLGAQRKEAGNLARDEERLSSLVGRLATLIAQQRKAEQEEAKRRESSRAEAAARERTQAAESARKEDKGDKSRITDTKLAARRPEPAEPLPPPDGSAFAALRGKARLPVQGQLVATYGA